MFVLLYKDEVKDAISLVGTTKVFEEDTEAPAMLEMLRMAQDHARATQPTYEFDWSHFLSTNKAASEDEDYKYQVMRFG